MTNSKEIMINYLKEAGLGEEEITKVGQVMDKELAGLVKAEATAALRKQQEAASAERRKIAELAQQNSIRNQHT